MLLQLRRCKVELATRCSALGFAGTKPKVMEPVRYSSALLLSLLFCCSFFLFAHGEVVEGFDGEMPDGMIQQVTGWRAVPLNLTPYLDPLPQTKKIYAYTSDKRGVNVPRNLTIGMFQKTLKFHRDLPPTTVFAYGQTLATARFPGPTIETIRGVPTYVTFENNLPLSHILPWDFTIPTPVIPPNGGIPTVVHLHGGTVSPDDDGSAFAWYTNNYATVGPGFTRKQYVYPNVQHSGNLMYHDHALGLTRINLLAGLLGAYVIRDPALDAALNLPSGDEFDRHLVVADRTFLADGSIFMDPVGVNPNIHPHWRPEYFGEAMTTNGKVWPYLNVQRRKYRFRIINACNARYLDLTFAALNGTTTFPFAVVGSDTSYLPAPVTTSNIVLSVAEIFDVVFDFSKVPASVTEIELLNSAPYPYPASPTSAVPTGVGKNIVKFILSPVPAADPSTIPASLVTYEPARATDATVTRYIALYEYKSAIDEVTHLYINGKPLTAPVTETPRTGSTELWQVINLTPDDHPLHLHLAQFQAIQMQEILDLPTFSACMTANNDVVQCNITAHAAGQTRPVPDYEKTWKNVVKLPPGWVTSVIVKFKLVDSNKPFPFDATKEPGYVYHCHILDHEDNEMIRPLKLLP